MMTKLENEVAELRARIISLAERVRTDAVSEAFLCGDHAVRVGDYFLLRDDFPTQLSNVNLEGKWTYFDGRDLVEQHRKPDPNEYKRLYTIAEVAEILAKAMFRSLVASESAETGDP